MKKRLLLPLLLLASLTFGQPTPDMPVAKYRNNATPYPLYAGVFGSSPAYDAKAIDLLAKNFDGYYGAFNVSSAEADALRAINPTFQLVKYQGSWQLSGDSRIRVEKQKDQVLHHRIGTLAAAISTSQTQFALSDLFGSLVPSTAPADVSVGYLENGVFKYVTWLRIGQEVMKITAVNGNQVTVIRGFDGTKPQAYAAGVEVLSPVYGTGPKPDMKTEISYRNDESTTLRWDNIYSALAAEYQKNKGGVWIDIVVGNLSQFAVSGETIPASRIWNLQENKPYDAATRARQSEIGIHYMQEKFRTQFGQYPVIWGNNMLFPTSLDDARIKLLIPTTAKPRPLDGFAQENSYAGYGTGGNSGDVFNWVGYDEWQGNLRSIMFMGEKKLAARPLIMDGGKDNGTFAKLPAERKHKLFLYSYASYLLAVKVEDDGSIYTKLGLTPVVDDNGKINLSLDSCFVWNIGKPAQTLASDSFRQYKLPNREVWVRRFENGIVLVNPTDREEANVDLTVFGRAFANPDTKMDFLTSITLPEHSGAILLNQNIMGQEISPAVGIYHNPTRESLTVSGLPAGGYRLEIFTFGGSLLQSDDLTVATQDGSLPVPLTAFPAGLYIMQLRAKKGTLNIIRRFVVE